jgi:hypothetical protein
VPSGGACVVCSVGTGVGVPNSPSASSANTTKFGNNTKANADKNMTVFISFLFLYFMMIPLSSEEVVLVNYFDIKVILEFIINHFSGN